MHVAPGSNASAETAGDFVVAQINMRTAGRADCRSRRARDLLFPFTIETLDNRTALSLPKILESAKNREELSGAGASSVVRSFRPGFGANGVKERPHWRQIELFAAAYSICLKPQCGHSALTFTGDGLATVCLPKPFFYARAPNAALIGSLGRTTSGRGAAFGNGSGGDFRFPDKSCPFFNCETRCFEISLQHAFGF